MLLAGALLALLLAIFIFRGDQAEYANMTARSDQLKAITDQTAATLSDLKDAETGQRGYLLTDNRSYLDPYYEGVRDYRESVLKLAGMTRGEAFASLADDYIKAGAEKIAELDGVLTRYNDGDRAGAIAIVDAGIGKTLMDKARNLSDRVTDAAESAFAANNRAIAVEVRLSRYRLFFAAGLLFCLTLSGAVLLDLRSQERNGAGARP